MTLQRVIQRAAEIECFDLIDQCRIIQRIDHPLILEQLQITPFLNQTRNLRIRSSAHAAKPA